IVRVNFKHRVGEGMLHYSFAQNGIMDQFKIITISKRVQEHRFDPQGQQGYALGFIDVLGVLLHAVYGGNKYFRIVFVPNFPFKIRRLCIHLNLTMHVAQLHIIEDWEEAECYSLQPRASSDPPLNGNRMWSIEGNLISSSLN
ncbi:hypothetical protein IFM89_025334, partial [Coptis chinensis]